MERVSPEALIDGGRGGVPETELRAQRMELESLAGPAEQEEAEVC